MNVTHKPRSESFYAMDIQRPNCTSAEVGSDLLRAGMLGGPQTELSFKFCRQAMNKNTGMAELAGKFLSYWF